MTMQTHKGADDKAQIDVETLEAGQRVALEIGDWNGTGFSYKQNGNVKINAIVVGVDGDTATMVRKDDRCEWDLATDEDTHDRLEFTVDESGEIEEFGIAGWNEALKNLELIGEPKFYKVKNGLDKKELFDRR